MKNTQAKIFVVMGVSGCGKTTIGKLLASALNIPFYDGDDYHSPANVNKMSKGKPLTDKDRLGWLRTLNQLAQENLSSGGGVIGCSALKKRYRELLAESIERHITYVYLEGTYEEIHRRMEQRSDHFMPSGLLKSQFETLEPPLKAVKVSITQSPEKIVHKILKTLGER